MQQSAILSDPVAEVFITSELDRRVPSAPDYNREKLAIQDLADNMADHPGDVLPRLVQLAMEICDASSAGVSVLEGDTFRWLGLRGALSVFEDSRTPRNDSPCGVCLDTSSAVLMRHPERAYKWISDADIVVPEVLLVPLFIKNVQLGTLWVIARDGRQFDSQHARILTELAAFTGVALRMIQADEKLKDALDAQELLTREMGHRIKNLFAVVDGMLRISSRGNDSKEEFVKTFAGRLRAYSDAHGLVRGSFAQRDVASVSLHELIDTILKPYHECRIEGPDLSLSERATSNLALVFHELATNAAKYGALSTEDGTVGVTWRVDEAAVVIRWEEHGGPTLRENTKSGFGTTLVQSSLASLQGTVDRQWNPRGLVVRLSVPLAQLG